MQRKIRFASRSETGSALVVALFLMIILFLLGTTLLTLSGTEHNIAYNAVWAEGAFDAAEAGIQSGISQLTADQTASTVAIPSGPSDPRNDGTNHVTIGGGTYTYQFRSGGRNDAGPMPLTFRAARYESGYSLALGTSYNPSGYVFYSYQIDATGTGPRNAQRQLQTLAEYGPVPK